MGAAGLGPFTWPALFSGAIAGVVAITLGTRRRRPEAAGEQSAQAQTSGLRKVMVPAMFTRRAGLATRHMRTVRATVERSIGPRWPSVAVQRMRLWANIAHCSQALQGCVRRFLDVVKAQSIGQAARLLGSTRRRSRCESWSMVSSHHAREARAT